MMCLHPLLLCVTLISANAQEEVAECAADDPDCKATRVASLLQQRKRTASLSSGEDGPKYVLFSDAERCHPTLRLAGWGDLGKGYTRDQCEDACSQSTGCKFFSMRSNGECTSFSACDKKTGNGRLPDLGEDGSGRGVF